MNKRIKFGSSCSKLPTTTGKTEENVVNVKTSSSQRTTVFQGENHSLNMCKILNDLRLQGICCDVNIRVPFNYPSMATRSEIAVYKAHSVVLTARSEFFKSFFTKLGNPNRLSFILPNFINPKAVEIVLHYMYTGRLSIKTDTISPIYQVGWLFQMDDVLLLCTQFCKLRNFKPSHVLVNNTSELNFVTDSENITVDDGEPDSNEVKIEKDCQMYIDEEINTNTGCASEREIEQNNKFDSISPEMSVTVRQTNQNELQLADGPPEMIECTPIIIESEDSVEDEVEENDVLCASESNNEVTSIDDVLGADFDISSRETCELKLIIFKPARGTEKYKAAKDDIMPSSVKNWIADAESTVVTFPPNKQYPTPVLYILDGIQNYIDELVRCRFFHVEFHVKNACRKGVVKTDGRLVCIMFGQVNHFFPLSHVITDADIDRYRQEKQRRQIALRKSANIKSEENFNRKWDPIFGNDQDSENDVLYCFTCSCVFFTIQGKASHLIRHHREVLHWDKDANSYKYKCGLCEVKFQNLRRLYFHRHLEHSWKLPEVVLQFRCGLCFVSVCSIYKARDHLNKFHQISTFGTKTYEIETIRPDNVETQQCEKSAMLGDIKNDSSDGVVFKCGQCKKELRSRAMVQIHERMHRGEKPYKCSECEYSTFYAGSLKTHVIKKHSAKTLNPSAARSPQKKKRRRRKKNHY